MERCISAVMYVNQPHLNLACWLQEDAHLRLLSGGREDSLWKVPC